MKQGLTESIADRSLIQSLKKRSRLILCRENRILFSQGESPCGLYVLRTGEAVLIMHSTSGSVVMCRHASAGSLLGLPGLVGNTPHTMTATVRRGSEVGFVARSDFEDLLKSEPVLYPQVLQILALELKAARRLR